MSLSLSKLNTAFLTLKDPRVVGRTRYPLNEILIMAVCAIICGCDDWESIALWAKYKEDWLKKYIRLEHGTPCEDTFARVFAVLNPEAFQTCFTEWMTSVFTTMTGQIIAIDGKTMRGSHSLKLGKKAIHIVSAFSSNQGITLAQKKIDGKSNEITAIPLLLDMLDLRGSTVTMDAMGCQRDIAEHVINAGADYVLGLKGNQGKLQDEVKDYFDIAEAEQYKHLIHSSQITVDNDHGRLETRRCVALSSENMSKKADWKGLQTILMVESTREFNDKFSVEKRYYISSLVPEAACLADAVRKHWHIENQLHWCLDVTFNEDKSRVRTDHAPENMNTIKKMTMNLLKLETSQKGNRATMPKKRLQAMLSDSYLEKVSGLILL